MKRIISVLAVMAIMAAMAAPALANANDNDNASVVGQRASDLNQPDQREEIGAGAGGQATSQDNGGLGRGGR